MIKLLSLDDFQQALAEDSPGHPQGWEDGFSEGRACGLAEAAASQDVLQAEAVQALADIGFTVNEAVAVLTARLEPLFEALAAKILPRFRDQLASEHLCSLLMAEASKALNQALVVSVHPQTQPGLLPVMAQCSAPRITIREDAALLPGQVLISDGETHSESLFDSDALWAEISTILEAFDSTLKEAGNHG